MTHETITDQQIKCTQNLPFEVIAIRQYNDSQLVNSAANNLSDPVSVKIRIRNKEEVGKKHGIISVPKLSAISGRKLRLTRSDQTIMSFDFFLEPDTSKKHQKKSHKNIFHIFRPGGCLRTQDDNDDEYHYTPSPFSDVNDIKGPSSIIGNETNIISEKITLKKNFLPIAPTNRTTAGNFMGKCKPGGCLDPPFNEDKYSYEPTAARSNASLTNKIGANKIALIRKATIESLNTISNIKINIQEISENIVRTQLDNNAYQENYSHSLITYPTTSTDNLQIHKQSYDTKFKKRISSEDKARISINEFSEIFFMSPKKDRAKILEKKSSNNGTDIENITVFDNKNSERSLINHNQIESSSSPIINITRPSNNDVLESTLNIVSYKKKSFIAETNADVEVFNDHLHTLEDVKSHESIQTVQISGLKSHSVEYIDKNIISNKNSTISICDTDKANKFIFDNTKTYSQKDISINKSTIDAVIQIKEIEEPILKDQYLKKESLESSQLDENNPPLLKNKDEQNIDVNNIKDYTAIPAIKTEYGEHSLEISQESFKIGHKDFTDTDKIKTPSLKSEKMQFIDPNKDSNYVVITSKYSKLSVQDSQEFIPKRHEEITKIDEIKATLSKSKITNDIENIDVIKSESDTFVQAIESKFSIKKSQETLIKDPVEIVDKNEVKKPFKTNVGRQNLETNALSTHYTFSEVEETTLDHSMSKDQVNRYFENHLEPDNIFLSGYHIVPFEKQKSMDILTIQEDVYLARNLSLDKNNIIDIYMIPDVGSLNKSIITVTSTEPVTLKTSDVELSLISLIQDETDEINFDEKRSITTVEKLKNLSLTESLFDDTNKDKFGPEKNIEAESDKDFNELNNRTTSIVHNISDLIKNQINELKDKTPSEISRVIENIDDKHKSNFNTIDGYNEVTKKLQSNGSDNLDKNYIKSKPSIDRVKEEKDINYILQTSNEDGVDVSTYSSVAIDFGFRCSVDNENNLVIHTFDTSTPSYEHVKTKVSVIKSVIGVNDDEIRIPINFDTDLSITIKKSEATSKDIISKKGSTPEQYLIEKSSDKTVNKDLLLQETLNSVYENLIPLNKIIQNLKEEANMLSRQQNSFKKNLETMEMKPKRLIHTDLRCGCEKH